MNQQEALKRLEALEAQNQLADIERSLADPETRARAQQYADDFDVNVEVVIKESMRIARRIAEIGRDAFDRELAAELGVTVMDLRSEAWRSEPGTEVARVQGVGSGTPCSDRPLASRRDVPWRRAGH